MAKQVKKIPVFVKMDKALSADVVITDSQGKKTTLTYICENAEGGVATRVAATAKENNNFVLVFKDPTA